MRVFAAAAVSLVLMTGVESQGQSSPVQTPPVFRAGVDYVELDVVVTDHDRAVKDLTRDDFEITERGRVQRIDQFRFEEVPPTRRAVNAATAIPAIDVATNTHAPNGRQWVLVIDDLHIFEQRLVETQRVVQSFLERLSPADQVAIVFTGHSNLSQDFTNDLDAQIRTVNRIRDALGFAEDAPSGIATGAKGAAAAAACGMRFFNARSSLSVLSNVAAGLSHSTFPRRAIVFVSQGLDYDPHEPPVDSRNLSTDPGATTLTTRSPTPNTAPDGAAQASDVCPHEGTNAREVTDEMHLLIDKARQSGVPIYSVDPRGITTNLDANRDGQTSDMKSMTLELDFLRNVADSTGGAAMVNRNMTQAIPDLVEDNSSFYLLGYYPAPFVRDGQFHDVKVTVKRPGVHVRSRVGYTAPKSGKTSSVEARQTLEDVLGSALPVAGLELRAFAAPVAASEHGMITAVTLEITYALPADAAKVADDIQFGIVAIDRDGKIHASTRHAYHFTGLAPKTGEVRYAINDTIDLPPQALTLRVAASSQALGRAGTVHLPVEVIKPSSNDVQMSGVVIGFDGPPREAAVPAGVLRDLVPFQPTTTRTFARTDTLRVFVPVFWGSADDAAEVTMGVSGDSSLPPRVETITGQSGARSGRHGAVDTTLALDSLAPGHYRLEITARTSHGSAARRDVAFEVK
jgi:VWFA-related protein